MLKNYKRMYIEELSKREFCENMKDYYKELVSRATEQIDYYRGQIADYETTCKKNKRLSNIGFWCGISSLVFVIVCMILKEIL